MLRDEPAEWTWRIREIDKRIRHTRGRLASALIELALEKGYEAVSIRELTGRAQVGYATFFRHYRDKDALLGDVLEVILAELLRLIQPVSADPQRAGMLVFRHAQENHALYRVLLDNPPSSPLLGRIFEVGVAGVLASFRPREDALVPAEVAAHHVIASFLALIGWWLDQGMPYPPERMGTIYRELIIAPAVTTAFEGGEPVALP
jgi:AcrR family transcriptional regulator